MGHARQKSRSTGQILEKNFFSPTIMKLGQNVVLMKSWTSLKMGHVWSKTRSLVQILELPCVRFRGHIFSPLIIKHDQNVCLDKILDEFENGSCRVKN